MWPGIFFVKKYTVALLSQQPKIVYLQVILIDSQLK